MCPFLAASDLVPKTFEHQHSKHFPDYFQLRQNVFYPLCSNSWQLWYKYSTWQQLVKKKSLLDLIGSIYHCFSTGIKRSFSGNTES